MSYLPRTFCLGIVACGLISGPALAQPQPQFPPSQQPQQSPPQQRQAPPRQEGPPQQQAPPQQPGFPGQEAQPQAAPQPTVVATVNGEPILQAEMQSQLQAQLQGQQVAPQDQQRLERQVLESLIDSRLVEQFVREQGPEVPEEEIQQTLQRVEQQLTAEGMSLDQYLQMQGLKKEMFRDRIAGSLGWQKYTQQQAADDKLRAHYEQNKEAFDGTEVRARHLMLPKEAPMEPGQPAAANGPGQAAQQAEEIRQAVEQGLDFAQAVEQYSADPGKAENGGDLGYFTRHGKLIDPIAEAAFSLEPGQVSKPIESPFGVHLIQVTDRKPGEQDFEAAKQDVAQVVQSEIWSKIVSEMRPKAEVKLQGS
ncbi:MAG: peptidylprolyl isomerase [Pirellulaceae bacterium]